MANKGQTLKYVMVVVAIILGIIGLVWLIHNIWKNIKINNISSWPTTPALVLSSMAQPANDAAGYDYVKPADIVVRSDIDAEYIPHVTYRYRVGNREYSSQNLVYDGPEIYNSFDTKRLFGPISAGQTIPVYYNPDDHEESYIYNGKTTWVGIVVGIILLLIALGMLFGANSKKMGIGSFGTSSLKSSSPDTPNLTDGYTYGAPAPQSKSFFRYLY